MTAIIIINSINPAKQQQQQFRIVSGSRSTILVALLLGSIIGHYHGRYYAAKEVIIEADRNNNAIPISTFDMATPTITTVSSSKKFRSSSRAVVKTSAGVSDSETNVDVKSFKTSHSSSLLNPNEEGWRTIQVFQGDIDQHLKATIKRPRTWYAQKRQDKLVLGLFRNKPMGYFIDLAANDAIFISNTLALEINANWTGLCIEPNPLYWYSLAYYRKCQVVAAVVGQNRMDAVDFTYRGIYGGIVDQKFDNRYQEFKADSKLQFTVPLAEIFEHHQQPNHQNYRHHHRRRHRVPKIIDYLSLDVEGAEEFVLRYFPFSNYTFLVLTVEQPNPSFRSLLNQTGHVLLKEISNWGETIWAHTSVLSELDLSVLN